MAKKRKYTPELHLSDRDLFLLGKLSDQFITGIKQCFYPLFCDCEKCIKIYGQVPPELLHRNRESDKAERFVQAQQKTPNHLNR